MLALAQQVVQELQQYRRLTLYTRLLLLSLEPTESSALSRYLPTGMSIDALDLENELTWAELLAGAGLLADFKALPGDIGLSRESTVAALKADQASILEYILELALKNQRLITAKLYKYVVRFSSTACAALLLRVHPGCVHNLLGFAFKLHQPQMVAFLMAQWPPSIKQDLEVLLCSASAYPNQNWSTVEPLVAAGAPVTEATMAKAAGAQNLELMSIYYDMGATNLETAVGMAFQAWAGSSLEWLRAHGANPELFLREANHYLLQQSSALVAKYWPEYLNLLLVEVARMTTPELMKQLLDWGADDTQGAAAQVLQDQFPERRRRKLVLLGATSSMSWSEWLLSWIS